MRVVISTAIIVSLLLFGCESKPSLQHYFVDHSEKKDFVIVDLSPSIVNVDKAKLTTEQKTALESFDKMNILVFKADSSNVKEYEAESQKVTKLLKDKDYQELMRVGSGKDGGSISFVGEEDHIDEFVLFGKKKDNGFVVVRILGNDMNPNNVLNMLSVLKNADIDSTRLEPLKVLMK